MICIHHIILTFVLRAFFVAAQYTFSNIHFQPSRLIFATHEWYQDLLDDNAIHRLPQMLIRDTVQAECDRSCWESEYAYSYYQYSTKTCLCSGEYAFAHNVIGGPFVPPDYNLETAAKFTFLNADFVSLTCTNITVGISYHNSTGTKVEDCINSCGNPSTERPIIYSIVTPGLYQEGPNDYVYEFQCECYERYDYGGDGICKYGVKHVFGKSIFI